MGRASWRISSGQFGWGLLALGLATGGCAMEQATSEDVAVTAQAQHAWGSYHWARTGNPFTLKLGDAVTTTWDSYLATTASDWSTAKDWSSTPTFNPPVAFADVLDAVVVPTSGVKPNSCKAISGQVLVCNAKYGANGWLGIAQIWANSDSHIVAATTKMNDTYFGTAKYNKPAWRNLVMCQEVGHTFGLGHQDEDHANPNLGTCMDYTDLPDSNQHPNEHDYEELAYIYQHSDTSTTLAAAPASAASAAHAAAAGWGDLVQSSGQGHQETYVDELGRGNVVVTDVIWAD